VTNRPTLREIKKDHVAACRLLDRDDGGWPLTSINSPGRRISRAVVSARRTLDEPFLWGLPTRAALLS
jgi:hypothetical protein